MSNEAQHLAFANRYLECSSKRRNDKVEVLPLSRCGDLDSSRECTTTFVPSLSCLPATAPAPLPWSQRSWQEREDATYDLPMM